MHLAIQTEFSFKQAYGPIDKVIERIKGMGHMAAGIADLNNTYGHVQWEQACKKAKIKPIFGVRLYVVPDGCKDRTWTRATILLAQNDKGLKRIYELVSKAWEQHYYFPRLFESQLQFLRMDDQNGVFICPEDHVQPANRYVNPEDKPVYEIIAGSQKRKDEYMFMFNETSYPAHIWSDGEMRGRGYDLGKIEHSALCLNASIQKAEMVKFKNPPDLMVLCKRGAARRGLDLTDPEYDERLKYEINLIQDKGYVDYFLIVADLVKKSKTKMLVGPSRGSSAGSLVCYLLDITEIEPIEHGLLFERFIDVNRFDLPDIDIDFPDTKRRDLIKYLKRKYGSDNVKHLGTVNRLMPKSAIGEAGKALSVIKSDLEEVKGAIIERSSGDARAAMCIADTFESTEIGKRFIETYPKMKIVSRIEGHASHSGMHAAGILVSNEAIANFAGMNNYMVNNNVAGIAMIDKWDAEYLGLLKIDCLGLRTLSILEDAARDSGMGIHDYYKLPLNDRATFDIFNHNRLSGVFQFEGQALRMVTKQMAVTEFEHLVAITSLARPGTLNSGGAARYVKYSQKPDEIKYHNDKHREITEPTFGIVVYQEQTMRLLKEIGNLSWADVTDLRKAMSKSFGDEYFGRYKVKFIKGSKENGNTDAVSELMWKDIVTFGSYGFNKSHAVAYGMISYWTAYMKAHHPLEFAAANLNHAKDVDTAVRILRDFVRYDKIEYVPLDPDNSIERWSIVDGKLIGGLMAMKGVGPSKANQIMRAREGKAKFTPALYRMLSDPKTDFDILFPTNHYWGFFYTDARSYGVVQPTEIESLPVEGDVAIIGRLVDRNIRDLNEYNVRVKRGGEFIEENNLYLNLIVEDDTDSILCTIDRYNFDRLNGKVIAETGKIGEDYYFITGSRAVNWSGIRIKTIANLWEWKNERAKSSNT